MKKRICLVMLLLVLAVANVFGIIGKTDRAVTGEVVTGDTITGEATQNVGMNISVIAYFPVLTILSPKNHTYIINESILLDYSVINQQAIWYKLDNLNNVTLTSPIFFNTSQGSHTLYLYANSSYGNLSSANVTFFVNSTIFVIYDDEFNEEPRNGANIRVNKKGQSTDFLNYTYEEMQNLSGVILDNIENGKIRFNQAVNLTDDENFNDNTLDLDSHTNISFKRIEINSSALPNFNKSATLWFYNLTFPNPRILRDGSVCPSSICIQESYTGGALKTLKFNVTGFSVYSVSETPAGETPETPGGGGGERVIKNFTLDREKIKISLKPGETKKQSLIIKNTGNQMLKVGIENSKLKNFIKINETNFSLGRGESKTIILDFIIKEDVIPDLYNGKLVVRADGVEKEVLIAIEVESKKPLFDVKVEIPEKYVYLLPGGEIIANIILYNFKETGKIDVNIEYIVKDGDGGVIMNESETRAVEKEISFVKTSEVPKDIKPGDYIFYVKVTYNGEVASSSTWFSAVSIEEELPFLKNEKILFIIALFTIITLLFVLFELRLLKKQMKTHMKIDERVIVREKLIEMKGGKKFRK